MANLLALKKELEDAVKENSAQLPKGAKQKLDALMTNPEGTEKEAALLAISSGAAWVVAALALEKVIGGALDLWEHYEKIMEMRPAGGPAYDRFVDRVSRTA